MLIKSKFQTAIQLSLSKTGKKRKNVLNFSKGQFSFFKYVFGRQSRGLRCN